MLTIQENHYFDHILNIICDHIYTHIYHIYIHMVFVAFSDQWDFHLLKSLSNLFKNFKS